MNKNKLKILGISGARSGSRGFPGKNIKKLKRKPLLAWPGEIARNSKYINRFILSTDSEEYARIANRHGLETPFLRPKELASDASVVIEYIKHAIDWLEENESYVPDIVVYLCPTTPLINYKDVDKAIELLIKDSKADSSILVSNVSGHPRKMVKVNPKSKKHMVSYMMGTGKALAPSNRQAYEKAYNRESLPVVSRIGTIKKKDSQTGERILYHQIPDETALDIDDELDFFVVEQVMKKRRKK